MDRFIGPKFAIVGLFFFLVGCGLTQSLVVPAADLSLEARFADIRLQSGEVARAILSVPLSDDDLARVSSAFAEYSTSRVSLETLAKSPEHLLDGFMTLQLEQARLRDAYLILHTVVTDNWDKYTAPDQVRMKQWKAQAERLEAKYNNFSLLVRMHVEDAEQQEALVELLKTVTQIALLVV